MPLHNLECFFSLLLFLFVLLLSLPLSFPPYVLLFIYTSPFGMLLNVSRCPSCLHQVHWVSNFFCLAFGRPISIFQCAFLFCSQIVRLLLKYFLNICIYILDYDICNKKFMHCTSSLVDNQQMEKM